MGAAKSKDWTDEQSLLALRMRDDGFSPKAIALATSVRGPARSENAVSNHLRRIDNDLASSETA